MKDTIKSLVRFLGVMGILWVGILLGYFAQHPSTTKVVKAKPKSITSISLIELAPVPTGQVLRQF